MGAVEGVENRDLTQHVCGAHPFHTRGWQTYKPRFRYPSTEYSEAISETRMAGHDDYLGYLAGLCIMRATKKFQALTQFLQIHNLSLLAPVDSARSELHRRVAVELFTQYALENFAAGVTRNFINKFHYLRLLEARQFALAKFEHIAST